MQTPTAADALFEECVTLDILSLEDALAQNVRDIPTEMRIASALFHEAGTEAWESFRAGCLFNGRPVDINEREARATIRAYGIRFGVDSFAGIAV